MVRFTTALASLLVATSAAAFVAQHGPVFRMQQPAPVCSSTAPPLANGFDNMDSLKRTAEAKINNILGNLQDLERIQSPAVQDMQV